MNKNSEKRTVRVLLGSSSKFRRSLFKRVLEIANKESNNVVFEQIELDSMVPDIDEKAIRRPDPSDLTKAITTAKTDKLLEMLEDEPELKKKLDLLVCGDQVIGFNGEIREKADSQKQVKEFLQSYGLTGHPAEAFSCIEVTNLNSGKRIIEVGVAKTFFKQVPDDVVQKLIDKEDILVCAGAFVIEDELLAPYIDRIEGELETMQGMPKVLVKDLLIKSIQ